MTWTVPVFVFFYVCVPLFHKFFNSYTKSWGLTVLLLLLSRVIESYGNGYFLAFSYMYFFAMGIVIHYTYKECKEELSVFIMAAGAIFYLIQSASENRFVFILFPILIISSRRMKIKEGIVREILQVVDRYSYTIYLTQGIIFCQVIDRYEIPKVCIPLLVILGTGVLSLVVYHLVECPVRSLGNKFVHSHKGSVRGVVEVSKTTAQ